MLIKPLFRLAESGNHWDRTFWDQLETEVEPNSCISDAAMFYKALRQQLIRMFATYVDETLHSECDNYLDFF